jgi:DNA helicase-2/ATP-dependent DNA helicase PcrA
LPDQTSETQFCADLIHKSHKDGKYSDWAVLYRMNAQSLGFEKEFLHRHIPYVVVGSLKFYEREEIKDTIAYISLVANPRDAVSFRRVVNKPVRGIGEKTQSSILQEALIQHDDGSIEYNDLINQTKKMSDGFSKKAKEGAQAFSKLFDVLRENITSGKNLSDFIQRVITDTGLDEYHRAGDKVEGTQRVANLQELVNSAVPYECSAQGLTEFLDSINLDRSLALSDEEKDDAVTLITLHNTKGLEYKKVIITGLEEGVFPRQDKQGADLEEERRLFYVGITRAQDELYITSVAKRWLYGNLQYVRPSVFLRESSDAFKVIGSVPFGFSVKKKNSFGEFGKTIPNPAGTEKTSQEKIIAAGRWGEKPEIAAAWPKGTKIYHDDYGYGIISRNYMNAGEYVIDVQFENGCVKKFIPEYQSKSLQKIKD